MMCLMMLFLFFLRKIIDAIVNLSTQTTHMLHPFYDSGRLPPAHVMIMMTMMMMRRRRLAKSAGVPMLDVAGEDVAEI